MTVVQLRTDARNDYKPKRVRKDRVKGEPRYLSEAEVEQLMDGCRGTRHELRDRALIMTMYRHGLRVSEAISLRRCDVDLKMAGISIVREKGSKGGNHPIGGGELRMIRRYLNSRSDTTPWLFVSQQNGPLSRQMVDRLIRNAAKVAGLTGVHAHTLRHSTGYYMAGQGRPTFEVAHYLGHKSLAMAAHYAHVNGDRFVGMFGD